MKSLSTKPRGCNCVWAEHTCLPHVSLGFGALRSTPAVSSAMYTSYAFR